MVKRFILFASLPIIAAAQSWGTLENGLYRDKTGVQFTLLPDWVLVSQAPSSAAGAHTVKLRDPASNTMATVWIKQRGANPEDIEAMMNQRLDDKAAQRNNFQNYKYRTESVQHITIGGRPALSAIADYVRAGQKMVEYLTWVDGEKSRVVFVGRMPASELANFQPRFDAVIQSAVVP
jgi:hypothetical protein